MDAVPTAFVVSWLVIHGAAIACALGTRISAGSTFEPVLQLLFFTALIAVGATAWYCQRLDHGLWIPSGMTLIAMVLTAVCDFRRTHEPPQAMHSFR